LAFGASCAFLTPAGYATNLMVMGPGGYHSRDYLRLGGGLTLLYLGIVFSYLNWIL
jgi:di/tricarboxylate transporter